MQRGVTAFVTTLGLGLVLSACGGGGSSTATISKAEFLKQGNAICKNGNKQIEAAAEQQFPKGRGRPSQAEQVKFATQMVISNIQHQIDAIKALGAPEGDEATVETITSEAQSALDEAKKDPTVLTGNGPGPFAKANKFANSYGLTACGSSEG
jgi:hypothetical protein